jgi:hypothetical protein
MKTFQSVLIVTSFILPICVMMAFKYKHKKYHLLFSTIVFWPLTVGIALSLMTAVAISSENFTIDNICFSSECFDYSLRTLAPAWMILAGSLAITGIAISTIRHDEVIAGKTFNERKQEIELFFKLRDEMTSIFNKLDSHNALKKNLLTDYGSMFNTLFPNFRYRLGSEVSEWQNQLYRTNCALSDITDDECNCYDSESGDKNGLSTNSKVFNAQRLVINLADLICEHTEYDSWGIGVLAKINYDNNKDENKKSENNILFDLGMNLFLNLARSGIFYIDGSKIEYAISNARKIKPKTDLPF